MYSPLSVFLDFNLPNATTWFYFSFLLAVALFFKFGRLLSIRNSDVVMLFLLVPGLLVVQRSRRVPGPAIDEPAVQAVALMGQCCPAPAPAAAAAPAAVSARIGIFVQHAHPGFEADRWQWYGYLWLMCGSVYFFCRCLFDLALVQRPALSPNLQFGGLAWLAGALLICLMAVAFRPHERVLAPTEFPGLPVPPQEGPVALLLAQLFDPPGWVFGLFAVLCHVAIVLGLVLVGWRHFGDASAGMAAATFYLMLPYTGLSIGQLAQAWPAALVVWAVVVFRYPILAGILLGLATGTAGFPLAVLPAWISFYSGRGSGRFLCAWVLTVGVCLANFASLFAETDITALGDGLGPWLPWRSNVTEGFWSGVHTAYRLPVFIAYLAFVLATIVWPSPKNLAHLLALTAAALVGLQLWYANQGGMYVLWYMPLLLLLAFRPNLQDHRPPPVDPATDWLARARDRLVRGLRRLAKIPEPAQAPRA
jgi:hypothetical protein